MQFVNCLYRLHNAFHVSLRTLLPVVGKSHIARINIQPRFFFIAGFTSITRSAIIPGIGYNPGMNRI